MRIIQSLLVLAAVLVAMGAAAQDLEIRFHWSECPPLGEYGLIMGPAVQYSVFVSRNGGQEELAGVTADTSFTLAVGRGEDVRVRVQGIDAQGVASLKSEWSEPLYFENSDLPLPRAAYLKPNYPNPFNPETTLRYLVPEDLPQGAPVALEVYNVKGQRVRALPIQADPGMHEVRWDGRDAQGNPAASGIYIARLMMGAMIETQKMTLTK